MDRCVRYEIVDYGLMNKTVLIYTVKEKDKHYSFNINDIFAGDA